MNPDQFIAPLKKLLSTLGPKQVVVLAAVFIAVIGIVVGSAYWISAPTYSLLASDLDAESAGSLVTKLKDAKVPYQLDAGGRAIRVPAERVDELRLQFAADGLPSAGRIGFEIFDRPAFGTTEFLEHVNYRRALEGELARTIATLGEIASARVHIAMAKDSLFAEQEQPAKASVVLRLKSNRPLSAQTVRGIAGLVSASVEALRPEAVVILDNFGRPLTRPADAESDTTSSVQLDRQQRIEKDLSTRVVALLEPVVGAGRVRVNVAARLKADAEEETEERWDPTSVVRSRQTSNENDVKAGVLGIAGARANLPPNLSTSTPAAPTPTSGAGASKTSEVTNYEVSKLTRHKLSPSGQLARLSVAVILDDERVSTPGAGGAVQVTNKARTPEEIQRIQGLVSAAVGFDQTRSDQITVENIAFEAPADDTTAPPPASSIWTQVKDLTSDNMSGLLRTVSITILALVAIFGVLRPMARRAAAAMPPPVLAAPAAVAALPERRPTLEELEGRLDAEMEAAVTPEKRRLPVLTKRVSKLAQAEPEQLARVVRSWLDDEER